MGALTRTRLGVPWLREFDCDLTRPDSLAASVDEALLHFGRLDACVTSAAVRRLHPIAELDPKEWEESVAVNLTSVLRLVQLTLPAIRRPAGLYVIIGSHAATRIFEGGVAYSATKAALKAVVETLLLEERACGVRATLVSPGAIANRDGGDSPYKMAAASVARCVADLVERQPSDLVVGEVEFRPALLPDPDVAGITRLQHV